MYERVQVGGHGLVSINCCGYVTWGESSGQVIHKNTKIDDRRASVHALSDLEWAIGNSYFQEVHSRERHLFVKAGSIIYIAAYYFFLFAGY